MAENNLPRERPADVKAKWAGLQGWVIEIRGEERRAQEAYRNGETSLPVEDMTSIPSWVWEELDGLSAPKRQVIYNESLALEKQAKRADSLADALSNKGDGEGAHKQHDRAELLRAQAHTLMKEYRARERDANELGLYY